MKKEIEKYERKNYYYSLALESYEDHTGTESDDVHNAWLKLADYRKNKESLKNKDRLEYAKEISSEFENVIETIGKEKFEIYDDGYVIYKWKGEKENE